MSSDTPLLSHADLARIGKVAGQCVKVDLSRISGAKLDSLMKTLVVRGQHELTGIGLNLDLHNTTKDQKQRVANSRTETRTSKTRSARGSCALSQSALLHRKGLASDIADVIAKVLSESDSIEFIGFRSVGLSSRDLQVLANSIFRAEALRTLHFCNIPLGDEGFAALCRALKKRSIVDLRCRKCGLTDECSGSLRSLISYHVSVQGEVEWHNSLSGLIPSPLVCLQYLDLRDNDLTSRTICEIGDSLLDLPLKVFDLRGNPAISENVVARLGREIPSTTIRTGPSLAIKHGKPRKKPYTSKVGQKSQSSEKEIIRKKGAQRNDEVAQTKESEEVVELEPGLAIVGARARELAEYLGQLDRLMQSSKIQEPSFFRRRETPVPGKVPTKTFKRRKARARSHVVASGQPRVA
jgi:hypothetical protein